MKKIICFLSLFVALNTFEVKGAYSLTKEEILSCVVSAEPRNKIDLIVKVYIIFKNNLYYYEYTLTSNPSSSQRIWLFAVDPLDPAKGKNQTYDEKGVEQKAPLGWKTTTGTPGLKVTALWGASEGHEIVSGTSTEGFLYATPTLPGITNYYAEGWAPIPEISCEFDDPIPGYDDLTPYGPGVTGKTIGPVEPPVIFNPSSFLSYIINLKKEAFNLGWITNKGIEQSLNTKLENAKRKLDAGDTKTAKNILNAFLNEVEAQKDKHLTSEAYGLLKYNVQYFIERL